MIGFELHVAQKNTQQRKKKKSQKVPQSSSNCSLAFAIILYKQRPVQVSLADVREIKACTIFEFRGTTPKKLI